MTSRARMLPNTTRGNSGEDEGRSCDDFNFEADSTGCDCDEITSRAAEYLLRNKRSRLKAGFCTYTWFMYTASVHIHTNAREIIKCLFLLQIVCSVAWNNLTLCGFRMQLSTLPVAYGQWRLQVHQRDAVVALSRCVQQPIASWTFCCSRSKFSKYSAVRHRESPCLHQPKMIFAKCGG
jgi:hypothetical protein